MYFFADFFRVVFVVWAVDVVSVIARTFGQLHYVVFFHSVTSFINGFCFIQDSR